MKKSLIIAGLMFILPVVASAASFVISTDTGSYSVGDTITLTVSVDPAASTIYTAMLNAAFSPDIFEVKSFTLNDALLPLKMAGYNTLDNTTGSLIKTGGYPGGAYSPTYFGTIVLHAKGSGVGTFSVNSDSKLLGANNSNQQTAVQSISFTINPASAKQTKNQVTDTEVITGTSTRTSTSSSSTVMAQLASVATFAISNNVILTALGLLVIILLVSVLTSRRTQASVPPKNTPPTQEGKK